MNTAKGKVVLVTGGAAGIGACIVDAFLQNGAKHVAALDINEEKGKELERELCLKYGVGKFKFVKCDVNSVELDAAFSVVRDELGYIDIVVNNAGIFNDSPAYYVDEIDLNFKATVTISLKAYNLMRQDRNAKGGTIINIGSIIALNLDHTFPIYSSTKRAVIHFSTCLGMAPHYSRSKVRVMTVIFGPTATESTRPNLEMQFDKETNDDFFNNALSYLNQLQSGESAARGVIDANHQGTSGSVWIVAYEKPARDITDCVIKSYQLTEEVVQNLGNISKL